MDTQFAQTLLGWVCQGFITVGLLVLAAKTGLFPRVFFFAGKMPEGSDESK